MMEMNPNTNSNRQNKSKVYFILGYVFLLMMALFSSVDTSIVYILLGLSVYFLFLGFYTRPSQQNFREPFKPSNKYPGAETTTFSDTVKNIFQQKQSNKTFSAKTVANPTTPEANRRIVTLVILAIFATFIIFFIGSIFSSSGEWDESTLYFQTAEQNYWSGNYDSAYLNYRKAWRLNEEYVEAMVGYGNVLAVRKQSDSAIIMFDKALQLNPDYKEASYNKASAYYNQEKYNESIEVLKPVLEKNTDYYDAMLLIGDCYYALKQFEDAINWYGNAYENGGARSHALCYIMAYIYDTNGDYGRAIDLYKEALSYDSTVVDIYKRLGELLPNEDGNYYRTQAVKLQQQ